MQDEVNRSLRRLCTLMALYAVAGSSWYLARREDSACLAYLLGVAGSFANLWLFTWVSAAIAPGENRRGPWRGGVFVLRYLILLLVGYVIVDTLGVSPLPVVLGLFASTAAVLISSTIEIVQSLLGAGRAP